MDESTNSTITHEGGGYTLRIFRTGVRETHAEIVDDMGGEYTYDNPNEARADFNALTGSEV